MYRATFETDSDEPVLVLVIPLRKCQRPAPTDKRRVIETTATELVGAALELRETA